MADHIFLSYRRIEPDETYTRNLADHLRREGFEVWMDNQIDCGCPLRPSGSTPRGGQRVSSIRGAKRRRMPAWRTMTTE